MEARPFIFPIKTLFSRRELQQTVMHIRQERMRDRKLNLWQLQWLYPGAAWAMDDAEERSGGTKYFFIMSRIYARHTNWSMWLQAPC